MENTFVNSSRTSRGVVVFVQGPNERSSLQYFGAMKSNLKTVCKARARKG